MISAHYPEKIFCQNIYQIFLSEYFWGVNKQFFQLISFFRKRDLGTFRNSFQLFLQTTNVLFPELSEIIDLFRSKILHRQCSEFSGAFTAALPKHSIKRMLMFLN